MSFKNDQPHYGEECSTHISTIVVSRGGSCLLGSTKLHQIHLILTFFITATMNLEYPSMTPRVTNLPRNLHVPANPNDSMEFKFQKKRLKFNLLSSLIMMPLSTELFYHHANPQKNCMSERICFKGPNKAKGS
jgi:hypothetical protein